MVVVLGEIAVACLIKIMVCKAEVKPDLGLIGLRIAVAQLTYKMIAIHSLSPSLRKITSYGTRRSAELINQGILFIFRKTLRLFNDFHRHLERQLIYIQIFVSTQTRHHTSPGDA